MRSIKKHQEGTTKEFFQNGVKVKNAVYMMKKHLLRSNGTKANK